MTRRLGVFGGTFDPVHHGHIDAVTAARAALAIEEILLVPSKNPPHRTEGPHTSAYHRFALVALAAGDLAGCRASDVELLRDGHSYTVDTLRHLHAEGWAPSQLFFIIGADAFSEIATWHQYPALLDSAHFAVIARPGTTIDSTFEQIPNLRSRIRAVTGSPEATETTGIFIIPAITRNISSTQIRQRVAAGLSIDDLVPPRVARHILAHHLYKTEDGLHVKDRDRPS